MSEVFVVEHRDLEKRFVAKLLRAELSSDAQTLDRVRIEAQALGKLDHENVVRVMDVGTSRDGRPFIIMEHLRGRSLAEEIGARKTIPLAEALGYTSELLSALAAVHAAGMVHRDVKPSNLFLCDLPNGRRVLKVLDFGVARVLPGAPDAPMPLSLPTETGAIVGTPRYISPEGAMGEHVDHRADLYGAALVLYAMLAGRGPFDHLQDSDLFVARATSDPPPPSRLAQEPIPAELDALVLRMLRQRPNERLQSADEFKERIAGIKQQLDCASSTSVAPVPVGAGSEGDASPFLMTEAVSRLDAGSTELLRPEDDVATHTAVQPPPAAAPERAEPVLPPAWKRVATAGAFLIIATVTFAIGVGLVRVARAYLGG